MPSTLAQRGGLLAPTTRHKGPRPLICRAAVRGSEGQATRPPKQGLMPKWLCARTVDPARCAALADSSSSLARSPQPARMHAWACAPCWAEQAPSKASKAQPPACMLTLRTARAQPGAPPRSRPAQLLSCPTQSPRRAHPAPPHPTSPSPAQARTTESRGSVAGRVGGWASDQAASALVPTPPSHPKQRANPVPEAAVTLAPLVRI